MNLKFKLHRLTHPEYWPFWAFYFPVFVLGPIFIFRARSLLFFTATNPCIPMGGCFGESKKQILDLLPLDYLPRAFFVDRNFSPDKFETWKQESGVSYPVIAKPDVGERGDHIAILSSSIELEAYAKKLSRPFIIQEFISSPHEFGVLVMRDLQSNLTRITSIVGKEFLRVTGDGVKTLAELMAQTPRSSFQLSRLSTYLDLQRIPPTGESIILEMVGNHARGTTFIDRRDLMTKELEKTFHEILKPLNGFTVGRFDLKAQDIESFKRGEGIKILELNGVFSEPGHIYDPQMTLGAAWRDLIIHWWQLSGLAQKNNQQGIKSTSLRTFFKAYRHHRRLIHSGALS